MNDDRELEQAACELAVQRMHGVLSLWVSKGRPVQASLMRGDGKWCEGEGATLGAAILAALKAGCEGEDSEFRDILEELRATRLTSRGEDMTVQSVAGLDVG